MKCDHLSHLYCRTEEQTHDPTDAQRVVSPRHHHQRDGTLDEDVGYGAVEHVEVGGRLETAAGEDHEGHGEVPGDPQQCRHAQHDQDELGGVGVLDEPFVVVGGG